MKKQRVLSPALANNGGKGELYPQYKNRNYNASETLQMATQKAKDSKLILLDIGLCLLMKFKQGDGMN